MNLRHRLMLGAAGAVAVMGVGAAGFDAAGAHVIPNVYLCVPASGQPSLCASTFSGSGSEGAFVVASNGTETGAQVECDEPGALTILTVINDDFRESSIPGIPPFCP